MNVLLADRRLNGVKKMSDTKRICCKDCAFFLREKDGLRGGIRGKCKIRRINEIRTGSMKACRMFKNEV